MLLRSPLVFSLFLAVLSTVAVPAAGLSFSDAQDGAGIAFVHASSTANQNYPETNGGGLCWADVDGDGTDDLLLVNGKYADADLQADLDPRTALYLNDGDGTFTDVSVAWGANLSGWYQGCSLADYDGDADLDAVLVGYDLVTLLRNDRHAFTDVTVAAGLTVIGKCPGSNHCFGETASWADYDLDGDLDMYVTNYADWNIDVGGPSGPAQYNGQANVLWRNNGDGTFTDVTAAAGVADDPGPAHSKSFQSSWADYDRDGDPDLYIASDTTPNTLFRNNGDGTFTDVAIQAGVDDSGAGMGLYFQDVTHDGLPDLYFTHYANENNGFYVNDGDGTFTDRTGEGDLATDFLNVGWGTGFYDFDHDGRVDVYAVNGHTNPMGGHAQKPRLWLQEGDGSFADESANAGPSFDTASVARGSAVADYDLDGDLDILLLAHFNESARLLKNTGDGTGRFLQVEVREPTGMNRFAIGAEVKVTPAGGVPTTRIVQAGSSFLSQDSLVVHAGLGAAVRADVTVRWPSGATESWPDIDAGLRVRLTRGDPVVRTDTVAPRTTVELFGTLGENGWFLGDVTVTLSSTDLAVGPPSGVAAVEYRVDGGAWTPYTSPLLVSGEGLRVVEARAADTAGNIEPVRRAVVGIDLVSPLATAIVTGSQGADGWYRSAADVTFLASDAASGVDRIVFAVDGAPAETGTGVRVAGSGTHEVAFHAVDAAGRVGADTVLVLPIDAEAPRVWPDAALVVGAGTVEVRVTAVDPTSGVRSVAFHLDGAPTPSAVDTDGSDGWSWSAEPSPGVHRVRAVARDAVDHVGFADVVLVVFSALPVAWPPALPLVALLAGVRLRFVTFPRIPKEVL